MLGSGFRNGWAVPAALVLFVGTAFFVGSRYSRAKTPILVEGAAKTPIPQASRPTAEPMPLAPASTLQVDVEGAVLHPGLRRLAADARVNDAIQIAGRGLDADTESLNLAAKLTDGTQLYVPHKTKPEDASRVSEGYRGGPTAPSAYSSAPPSGGSHSGGGKKHPSSPVSLNTGSESQLESLPGVGPSTAQKILDYRREHGGFSSVNELLAVKGIGPKKFKAMKQWLRL